MLLHFKEQGDFQRPDYGTTFSMMKVNIKNCEIWFKRETQLWYGLLKRLIKDPKVGNEWQKSGTGYLELKAT